MKEMMLWLLMLEESCEESSMFWIMRISNIMKEREREREREREM